MTLVPARRAGGLNLPRNEVLWMLMMAVIGFGVMVPVAGLLADAFGGRRKEHDRDYLDDHPLRAVCFQTTAGLRSAGARLCLPAVGPGLMGLTFGPMGALLPGYFRRVRYTGASFSYNVSSILGASVAPYIAAGWQGNYGLMAVGLYLAAMAGLALIALLLTYETRHPVAVIPTARRAIRPGVLRPLIFHLR